MFILKRYLRSRNCLKRRTWSSGIKLKFNIWGYLLTYFLSHWEKVPTPRERSVYFNFPKPSGLDYPLNIVNLLIYLMVCVSFQNVCEKGLVGMENSHRRQIAELQTKHEQELAALRQEKEQALAEETHATLAGRNCLKFSLEILK